MVTKEQLMERWPPYRDQWKVVKRGNQSVQDLINAIADWHEKFKPYYDQAAPLFDNGRPVDQIAKDLYRFVKKNIRYQEEPGARQTTAVPTGLLVRGHGDCKHYAGFIGGILDALRRAGRRINWAYRFVSYKPLDSRPHHVFVVINPGSDQEIWVDPVPGADQATPIWQMDIKP